MGLFKSPIGVPTTSSPTAQTLQGYTPLDFSFASNTLAASFQIDSDASGVLLANDNGSLLVKDSTGSFSNVKGSQLISTSDSFTISLNPSFVYWTDNNYGNYLRFYPNCMAFLNGMMYGMPITTSRVQIIKGAFTSDTGYNVSLSTDSSNHLLVNGVYEVFDENSLNIQGFAHVSRALIHVKSRTITDPSTITSLFYGDTYIVPSVAIS